MPGRNHSGIKKTATASSPIRTRQTLEESQFYFRWPASRRPFHVLPTMTSTALSAPQSTNESQHDPEPEVDPVWRSSRTARQIYALGLVEKVCPSSRPFRTTDRVYSDLLLQDISRLLSLAASSISLLTLPQTDEPNDGLPQGGERSEQFVLVVSEYFERLDVSGPSDKNLPLCRLRP